MKAAVYYKKNDVRVVDIPVPEVGERDVRIRVKFCGVCGNGPAHLPRRRRARRRCPRAR